MVLYYAMGGGLGHLTRAGAVWNTLKINLHKILLLTASTHAHEPYIPANVRVLHVEARMQEKENREEYENFLKNILLENNISAIYLDAFPLGIIKEWCFLADFLKENKLNIKIYYLARLLNDNYFDNYFDNIEKFNNTSEKKSANIFYDTVFLLENLTSKNLAYIQKYTKNIENLTLNYPKIVKNQLNTDFFGNLSTDLLENLPKNYWLIVHSEPLKEIEILLDFATKIAHKEGLEPFIIIICAVEISQKMQDLREKNNKNILWTNYYPASDLFEKAQKIFSAAGFNIMQQILPYYRKHYLMPFQRKLDLQEERAKQYIEIHK